MISGGAYEVQCKEWMLEQIDELTDRMVILDPSEWAEEQRYLPPSVTDLPGFYSFDVAPYLREILDCLSPHSPVREVDVMKGVQLGFTVGILENAIGYYMAHIKNAPMMLVTADAELAKLRSESYITPMINYSGLDHLIKSADEHNPQKRGKTDAKIEWQGGGFLTLFGAQNANKLRSTTIRILLEDEIDGWPDKVGKDGDPQKLVEDRTASTETTRKIMRGSTPLILQTSKIYRGYKLGDKRLYFVPCKFCGEMQILEFNRVDKATGALYGLHFEEKDGRLIQESVRYICKYCHREHTNDDKSYMLPRGEWRPTAEPASPTRRSYSINSLYAPVGMRSWEEICRQWLECWDTANSRARDTTLLQTFYNNNLGRPFEARGDSVNIQRVLAHRREQYSAGEVPNKLAIEETGDRVLLLTCAVDVHKKHLDVQVCGWCPGDRMYSIDWLVFQGEDCRDIEDTAWSELRQLIEHKVYESADGCLYRIQVTLIDSQYSQNVVLAFCEEYSNGVYPIAGMELSKKGAKIKEFSEFKTTLGMIGYNITTTIYKDRLSTSLKRERPLEGLHPERSLNFPRNYPDSFFKQLTVEYKAARIDKVTGQNLGFVWHRPGNAANHAWDLTVYNCAALDMVMHDICQRELGLEVVDRMEFWELCRVSELFFDRKPLTK